jgi:hypothetical protein
VNPLDEFSGPQYLASSEIYAFTGARRYRGTILGSDRHYEVDGVHGVCESMHARL